jgi:hypothetical protein
MPYVMPAFMAPGRRRFRKQTLSVRHEDFDLKVIPLLMGKVFHASRACHEILVRKLILPNKSGKLKTGYFSPSPSFSRYYDYISLWDLRDRCASDLDNFALYPSTDGPIRKDSIYCFVLSKAAWPNVILNDEIKARPRPDGITFLNYVPILECCYPEAIPLALVEAVIKVECKYPA